MLSRTERKAGGAFTLIELMVVIAVIGVLLGVMLPSLAGARRQARLTRELAAVRSLLAAYTSYALENKSSLLPGHVAQAPSLRDDAGKVLSPAEVGKRWPWRLAPYIGSSLHGSLLVDERSRALADRTMAMWSYYVSLTPSFGLNYFHLGGDTAQPNQTLAGDVLTRLDQAVTPSRFVTFASARFPSETGFSEGYFKIVPPTRAFEYSATGWSSEGYSDRLEPAAFGYIHPRWEGKAAVGHLDGNATTLSLEMLRDMRRWSQAAALAGESDWRQKP